MIHIDGSQGEGGGQVLRSALTLSVLTRQAMRIDNIRAGRSKPGLSAQHLQAVMAAAAISNAEVEGVKMGTTSLSFRPGEIRAGDYHFDIGTAGATTLVLQTIFLPLSMAKQSSMVTITGGTHVPWSPCFHYLDLNWLPALKRMGHNAELSLEAAGFYPRGGGRITASIHPTKQLSSFKAIRRGQLLRVDGISAVANLDRNIAERQRDQALRRLEIIQKPVEIDIVSMPARAKGTMLLLLAKFENAQVSYFSLGKRGKLAERVADEAVNALVAFQETNGAIDQYLADQLLLPLAFANGESEFRTSEITKHLVTNAQIIQIFSAAKIEIQGKLGNSGVIRVSPG